MRLHPTLLSLKQHNNNSFRHASTSHFIIIKGTVDVSLDVPTYILIHNGALLNFI